MRIVLQAIIDHAQEKRETVEIGVVERPSDAAPSSGLRLLLAESREILAAMQAVVVAEQTKEVVKAMSRCASCLDPLDMKDTKIIVYRTAFGKAWRHASYSGGVASRTLKAHPWSPRRSLSSHCCWR